MATANKTNPIDHVKNIIDEVSRSVIAIRNQITSTDIENDERVLFGKMYSNKLLSYYASLRLFAESAANIPFWENIVKNEVNKVFIEDRFYFFKQSTQDSIFLTTMIDYEASLRSIMKDVWCDYKDDKKMKEIYEKAIDLCGLPKDYYELNKVLVYSRNAMHNGWVHKKPDVTITYKSNSFVFKEKYPIEISWSDLEFLITELMAFWKVLVCASPIKDKSFIEHYGTSALRLHNTSMAKP